VARSLHSTRRTKTERNKHALPSIFAVELIAGLEAHMADRKIIVPSTILDQIKKTAEKLRKVRPRVSSKDQTKIDLEIKELAKCKNALRVYCRKMTHAFRPKEEDER